MIYILTPDGKIKIGNSMNFEDTLNHFKRFDNNFQFTTEAGTLAMFNGSSSSDSLANKPILLLKTNNQSFTYYNELGNTSTAQLPIQSYSPIYTKWAEYYIKDNIIKVKIITEDIDDNNNIIVKDQGYFIPSTGLESSTDLTGYRLMYTVQYTCNWINGNLFFNSIGSAMDQYAYSGYGGSLGIVTQSNPQKSTVNSQITFNVSYLDKATKDHIEDLSDTVSDLSSESAAKFVSR